MAQFDPYYQWLGIPKKDQPVNYYRLLNLQLFEENPDVIENAATRQLTFVKTFQTGKHAAISQQLMNEISAARACLLDPRKKASYDSQLQPAVWTEVAEETDVGIGIAPVPIAHRERRIPWLPIVASVCVGVVIGVVVWVLAQRANEADRRLAESTSRSSTLDDLTTPKHRIQLDPPAKKPPAKKPPAKKPTSKAPTEPAPKQPAKNPAKTEPPKTEPPKTEPKKSVGDATKVVDVPKQSPIPTSDKRVPFENIPAVLTDGFVFYNGGNRKGNELEFQVLADTMVYMIVSDRHGCGGNSSGGWKPHITSHEKLVAEGWRRVGSAVFRDKRNHKKPFTIYAKTCKKGERHVYSWEKYVPPALIVPVVPSLVSALPSTLDRTTPPKTAPAPSVQKGPLQVVVGAPKVEDVLRMKFARIRFSGAVEPFKLAPADAKNGIKQAPQALLRGLVTTPQQPYNGHRGFAVMSDGIVLAGIFQSSWGDRNLSGGDWRERIQSRQQLAGMGWQAISEMHDGHMLLIFRHCKKGEELYLQTKKYATPYLFLPAAKLRQLRDTSVTTKIIDDYKVKGLDEVLRKRFAVIDPVGELVKFQVVPKAQFGEPQTSGFFEIPMRLAKGYRYTKPLKYQGRRDFTIKRDGIVLAAIHRRDWGDPTTSGGPWRKEVQSEAQLKQLGWKILGTINSGDFYLMYRDCKKGEKLYLRTKKYATPLIVLK